MKTSLLTRLLAVAFGIGVVEVSLQALSRIAPSAYGLALGREIDLAARAAVPDKRLGHRPSPNYPEHDANGFRNASIPTSADIVTLGDSQTYGAQVSPGDPWPRRLAEKTGRTVYNMGFGGWCPGQYLLLMPDAVKFRPKVIVTEFYSGNDLYDCFSVAYYNGQLADLKTANETEQKKIRELEQRQTLKQYVPTTYLRQKPVSELPAMRQFGVWIDDHVRLAQVSGRIQDLYRQRYAPPQWEDIKAMYSEFVRCDIYEGPRAKSVLTPYSRLAGADLSDARIREGFEIALASLRRMDEAARAAGATHLIFLLPTKELVFKDEVNQHGGGTGALRKQLANEEELWRLTREYFERNKLRYFDTLPDLRNALAAGEQPFPMSEDGHLNPGGHRVVADAVAREIAAMGK